MVLFILFYLYDEYLNIESKILPDKNIKYDRLFIRALHLMCRTASNK